MHNPIKLSVYKLRSIIPEFKIITVKYDQKSDYFDHNNISINLQSIYEYKNEYRSKEYYVQIIKQLIKNKISKCNLRLYVYFSILHEYCHYLQYINNPINHQIKFLEKYDWLVEKYSKGGITKYQFSLEYRNLPLEKEADEFALNFIKENYDKLFL